MLKIIKADGKSEYQELEKMAKRSEEVADSVTQSVSEILCDVRKNGDKAVKKYTSLFDKVETENFRLDKALLKKAAESIDKELFKALSAAKESILFFHNHQKKQGFEVETEEGTMLGQTVRPLNRVGLYVPGGTASYPSSVLMNALPAKVAGVKELVMVTPPQKNGQFNPVVLAAAYLCEVDELICIGGAQAVAALAYGTESIKKVDKIVGPGNIFVATAKRLVYGTCDIDMIAGPSEILIIADKTANPKFIAADMLSQAEHDTLASAVLLCTDESLAQRVKEEIELQLKTLSRAEIAKKSISDFGLCIVCESIDKAVEIANMVAPEHLEVMCENPKELVDKIYNAGSIFLGEYSPEPFGDYCAGPNHVLPTSGSARFFSPLSVESFYKRQSYILASKKSLEAKKDVIIKIAEAEGLTAHANSIKVRFYE